MRSIQLLAVIVLAFTIGPASFADEADKPVQNGEPFLTVRLVDEDGKPVADADLGFLYYCHHHDEKKWKFFRGVKSDANGQGRFYEGEESAKELGIYARHAERHLVAVQKSANPSSQNMRTLTMVPECRVSYRLSCKQIADPERRLSAIIGFESQKLVQEIYGLVESSNQAYLPPGKYVMTSYGEDANTVETAIEIHDGQRELDLGTIDHPATKLALLEGQLAPELHDVIEWKNGPALKLCNLRGKVILLEFWGSWCGPCIHRGVPEMFKLQEKYQGRDLVMVGVHVDDDDNKVVSVEKLDEKLASIRKNIWKGKDISFPVALISSKWTPLSPGSEEKARSELSAEYGIVGYPTTVIIGRDGKIIGKFNPYREEHQAKLAKLLDEPNVVP